MPVSLYTTFLNLSLTNSLDIRNATTRIVEGRIEESTTLIATGVPIVNTKNGKLATSLCQLDTCELFLKGIRLLIPQMPLSIQPTGWIKSTHEQHAVSFYHPSSRCQLTF